MYRLLVAFMLLAFATVPAGAVPFWGAKASSPADTAPAALKPGEFVWGPDVAPEGPIVVVVSLTEQRAYVYRNGIQIGVTTVSTGKPGHDTPTGIFTILQKDKDHHSSVYNDAAMPYQERLTWDGVALHAGGLPGYPSSHGCVHLPSTLAEDLFAASHLGMTVVVVNTKTAPADVVHPAVLVPVNAHRRGRHRSAPAGRHALALAAGEVPRRAGLDHDERRRSARDRAPNGIEIGRARLTVTSLASHSARMRSSSRPGKGKGDQRAARRRARAQLDGRADARLSRRRRQRAVRVAAGRLHMPQDFARSLYPLLTPGTTLLLTDAPVLEENSGRADDDNGCRNSWLIGLGLRCSSPCVAHRVYPLLPSPNPCSVRRSREGRCASVLAAGRLHSVRGCP